MLLLTAATALPAHAQQDSTRIPLPAITVNVLRAGLPLGTLPLSRTLLRPEQTVAMGAGASLEEALRTVPGLQLDNRHNQALGERFSIRGFGARAGFGIRGIRVLVDGIPATMPDGQSTLNHVDPSQLSGAEVVRGAAAAFLGNSAGGAVLLRTGSAPGVAAEVSAGAAELRRASVSYGGERVSAYAMWQQQAGFRAYSAWDRVLLGGTAALPAGAGRLEIAAHGVRYDADNPGALTAEQFAADPSQASANNVRQQTGERGTHAQLGAGWLFPVGDYRLELRAHSGVRSLDNPIPPRIIELERAFGGVRAQAAREMGALALAAGAEAEWQRDDRVNHINVEGDRGDLVLDQLEDVRTVAAFAHAQWQPLARLRVFGAVRADRQRFAAEDRLPSDGVQTGDRDMGATTGSVGAMLQPFAGLELFASAATAFETPTTTELVNSPSGTGGFNQELDPERTRSFEAGVRGGNSMLDAELVLFRADVRDKLVAYEIESMPGRQLYHNAGRARQQGVEVAAELRPLEALSLRGAYTRLDARFREYVVGTQDYSGRRIPGAAAHQLHGSATLRALGGSARLHVRRTGRVMANDSNAGAADAYTLLDARISHDGVRLAGVRTSLYAGANNLLDRKYAAAVSVNAFGGRYFEPGPGRSFYAGLRFATR